MVSVQSSPRDSFTRILGQVEGADTRQDLHSTLPDIRDYFGIGHVAYLWLDTSGIPFLCTTYSERWNRRYQAQDHIRHDPVIAGCLPSFRPVDWKQLDWSSKAAQLYWTQAIEHGVGNQGYSIPIRGPLGQFALLTVSDTCSDADWATFTLSHRFDLMLIAHMIHDKALTLSASRPSPKSQPLSPREVEALTLLAAGHNRAQVADRLSISEHTLRVYIESARLKLGAANTIHAVARALSRGLIAA